MTASLQNYCERNGLMAIGCRMGIPGEEVVVYPPVGYGYNIPWWDFRKLYVKDNPERDMFLAELLANNK